VALFPSCGERVVKRREQIQLPKYRGFLEHQPMYKVQAKVITPHYFAVFTTSLVIREVTPSPGTF
jgi:hypothetical protein